MTDPTVFTGARLIDGTGAAPVESVAVVVENGRFTYVGPEESRPQVDGSTVVDLGGRTLLPGFFDCHVHFLMDGNADFTGRLLTNRPTVTVFERAQRMRQTLHAGVTTARDLGGIDAGYRDAVARGLIEGPRLHVVAMDQAETFFHETWDDLYGPASKAEQRGWLYGPEDDPDVTAADTGVAARWSRRPYVRSLLWDRIAAWAR